MALFGGQKKSANVPRGSQGAGVAPLSGLAGFVNDDAFASAEDRNGGTADPRHAKLGQSLTPVNTQGLQYEQFAGAPHGPYGMDTELLGWDVYSVADYTLPGGAVGDDPTGDTQPYTRAAPWPTGVPQSVQPDDVLARRAQQDAIHASGKGASREMTQIPTLVAQQDRWTELAENGPGISFQEKVPQQVGSSAGGWGSRDRVQSNAQQNQYGYDSAHLHRRFAEPNIPGNSLWMKPGGRPLVKTIPGTAQIAVGPDSPFTGQDTKIAYDQRGAVLSQLPVQYQAAPDPATATGYPSSYTDDGSIGMDGFF